MIKEPKVGMNVMITKNCCDGHEKGSIGVIEAIDTTDRMPLFEVRNNKTDELFWHCPNCTTRF